jgi:glycosyltransferase involved in cell wall biosynthesis
MKVSVIMPTYNRAEMLKEAIQSFFDQDYQDAELIILDNGSTDHTRDVIINMSFREGYYNGVDRISLYKNNSNITPPHNFNQLLKYATGDLICHLHDDDRLTKDSLSLRVEAFKKDPQLQVLYAGWITGDKTYYAPRPDKERIMKDEYINFLTMMWRKDVNGWMDPDLRYYHDWLFKIQCFQKYKVGHIPDPVIYYTIHLGQASIECRKLGMNGPEEQLMRKKLDGQV